MTSRNNIKRQQNTLKVDPKVAAYFDEEIKKAKKNQVQNMGIASHEIPNLPQDFIEKLQKSQIKEAVAILSNKPINEIIQVFKTLQNYNGELANTIKSELVFPFEETANQNALTYFNETMTEVEPGTPKDDFITHLLGKYVQSTTITPEDMKEFRKPYDLCWMSTTPEKDIDTIKTKINTLMHTAIAIGNSDDVATALGFIVTNPNLPPSFAQELLLQGYEIQALERQKTLQNIRAIPMSSRNAILSENKRGPLTSLIEKGLKTADITTIFDKITEKVFPTTQTEPTPYAKEDVLTLCNIFSNPTIPTKDKTKQITKIMETHKNTKETLQLLQNIDFTTIPGSDDEIYKTALTQSQNTLTIAALAKNKTLSIQTLKNIYEDTQHNFNEKTLIALAANPSLPKPILEKLTKHKLARVRTMATKTINN